MKPIIILNRYNAWVEDDRYIEVPYLGIDEIRVKVDDIVTYHGELVGKSTEWVSKESKTIFGKDKIEKVLETNYIDLPGSLVEIRNYDGECRIAVEESVEELDKILVRNI